MKNTSVHISYLKLEKYVLGELPEEEKKEIDDLIKIDTEIAARYESILKSNQEILSLYPSEGMALKIQWKYSQEAPINKKRKRAFPIRTLSFAGAFLTLFILTFILIPAEKLPFYSSHQDEIVRPKGDIAIKIYRKTNQGAELLSSGTSVQKDDRCQIKYFAGDQKFGIIFSIDGNGYITLHYPLSKDESLLLDQGGEMALIESFRLDDAPDFERFFFVTSKETFSIYEALEAGYQLAEDPEKAKIENLELPEKFKQKSFILIKED